MKNCFTFLAAVLSFTLFTLPVKSAGPAIAGHYLTTGQVLVGVTGSAPVANTLLGTSGQIAVAQGAEGGNFQFSFPTNVQMTNLTVTGTASWLSTGTYTAQDLIATYGVAAATGVYSGAVTGASFSATGALSGATLATTGAGTIVGAAYIGASNTVSTVAANGVITSGAGIVATTSVAAGTTVTGATGLFATAGPVRLYSRTKAQLNLIVPGAAGEQYYCSNCIDAAVVISSGTGAGAFVQSSSATVHMN